MDMEDIALLIMTAGLGLGAALLVAAQIRPLTEARLNRARQVARVGGFLLVAGALILSLLR